MVKKPVIFVSEFRGGATLERPSHIRPYAVRRAFFVSHAVRAKCSSLFPRSLVVFHFYWCLTSRTPLGDVANTGNFVEFTDQDLSIACGCDDANYTDNTNDADDADDAGKVCSNGFNGIESEGGSVCCHADCGTCGGSGCANRASSVGLTKGDCCVNE